MSRLIHPSNTKKMASSISKRNQNNVSEQDISQQTSDDADYISSMPQEVLLKILYFLPLKYWTILSAVSSKWKNLWTYISIINLDELEMIVKIIKGDVCRHLIDEFPSSSSYAYQHLQRLAHAARRKFADFVDRLILFHSGCAIDNFRLSFRYVAQDEYASRVDKWVHFAMTSNTKRIELNFSEAINYHRREGWQGNQTNFAQPYTLRPYSFVSRILETLILNYCKFEAFSFGQFVSLRRLCLICAEVLDRSIGDLVSKCPALEDLTLESCFIPDKFFVCGQELNIKSLFLIYCMTRNWVMFPINIATPELLSLTIVGTYLMSSSINKATKLVDVTIDIQQGIVNPTQGNFLASLLISLNHCQDLTLSSWCIQVLPTADSRDVFEEIFSEFVYLEEFNSMEAQASLFSCLQNCLKKVVINRFIGISGEMQMIKFLLRNARVLEIVEIHYYGLNSSAPPQEKIAYGWFQLINKRRMMSFQRASPQARVKMQPIELCYLSFPN
ncbi:unnamed protein product [Camellia sinensis]